MLKFFYIISIFILFTNCALKQVSSNHGTKFIDKKEKKLFLNSTNKNDIVKLLGPPSTKSTFDNDIWFYIERKNSKKSIFTFGSSKTVENNVLVLELDKKGILVKKDIYRLDEMKKIDFTEDQTSINYSKNSFVYDFLTSIRQKIDNPKNNRNK
jgi:outer membrane protein assembly factor BamE (lipoprotein component of BamABCDE complex)